MNWIGLLIIFVFNTSFPHLSPGCGLQVDKRTHLSLHNHTDCQETDGNTIVEDHFFLTGHVTVKTQIKNGGTLGFLFVKAVWSLWELNQLQPAKEKKKNLSHKKNVVSFHHFKINEPKEYYLQNKTNFTSKSNFLNKLHLVYHDPPTFIWDKSASSKVPASSESEVTIMLRHTHLEFTVYKSTYLSSWLGSSDIIWFRCYTYTY